ncbi:protein phosphatase 1 regulatory subunit 3F [Emydura macquarii macquarii]|uniref:protein phosphatase 1 regulatory subunit 3F n=1 Tax=Emydura macquarii macquarii TaxID=1129001 RepID=UPI00352A3805
MAGAAPPSPRPPLCRPRAGEEGAEEEEEEEGPPLPRAPRPAWQLSQHAPGHGQGAPSQHALGQPHSQHAPGHGQEAPSQHALGHGQESPSQHALGHGQGAPSQHALGQPHSQHALGHGQEAPSQHALGQPHSQHAPGHGQGAPSQHAPGQPPPHAAAVARRVLFADALGLPLTRLRRYQPWPPPSPESPPEVLPPAGQPPPAPYLLPAFVLPPPGQGEPERLARLRRAKVELEEVLAPGPGAPWLLRGVVRVLNVAYRKAVHVRASRDRWRTYRDHPARYVPGGSPDGGLSDRFAFSLPFGPTEEEEGEEEEEEEEEEEGDEARLDFVIRYQTDEGVYWANNQGKNYRVVLKGVAPPWGRPRTAGRDGEGRHLRSCMRLGKMRPCAEEPSQEEAANPVGEEEGRLEREPLRGSPPAPAPQPPGQVAAHSLEKEPPAGEPPVPECPWGGRGPEAGELWQPEEEAVDQELEQLYVSHLSRLRAEQLWDAGGQAGGVEAAGLPPAWLPALRQDVLSDRDLVAHWAGPERALNSSLVQEITLRYASPPGPGQGEGVGRDSPPALLEGGLLSRLAASAAAVVVPARTAVSVGRGPGAQRGPRSPWLGSQPREGAPGGPTRLGQALTRSLLIFGLVVVLPVFLSGCLPAAALALYALLTWRRVT